MKLRIYKVYTLEDTNQRGHSRLQNPVWKEVNVLDKLGFEVDDSEEGHVDENEEIKSDLLLGMGSKKGSGM